MDRAVKIGLGIGAVAGLFALRALLRPDYPKPGTPCFPKQFAGACDSGLRKSAPIWIVIHSTEGGPTAAGTAGSFTAPNWPDV